MRQPMPPTQVVPEADQRWWSGLLEAHARGWHEGRPVPMDDWVRKEPRLLEEPALLRALLAQEWALCRDAGIPECREPPVGLLAVGKSLRPPATSDLRFTLPPPLLNSLRDRLPTMPGLEWIRELGRGGFGHVWLAHQTHLDRLVAVKLVPALPGLARRVASEARALGKLHHPHLVQIHETGEVEGLTYILMEYVPGPTLGERLAAGPVAPAWLAWLIEQLARAMAHAHEAGIVHRDLKPANILLTPGRETESEEPRIVDFGLARLLDESDHPTRSGDLLGTVTYMAPEQAEGQSHCVGPATDIWALGVLLYEGLTGHVPFRGQSLTETLRQIRSEDPVAPCRLVPGVPGELETICLRCLEKVPARRYASAADLAEDLARFRAGQAIRARPTGFLRRLWRRSRGYVSLVLIALGLVVPALLSYLMTSSMAVAEPETAEYFHDFVRRYNCLVGVGRVPDDQVARRLITYRIVRRGERMLRLEQVDARGEVMALGMLMPLVHDPDDPFLDSSAHDGVRVEMLYNDRQQLQEQTTLDRTGTRVCWRCLHITDPRALHGAMQFMDQQGVPMTWAPGEASCVVYRLGQDGFDEEWRFTDIARQPRPSAAGIFGIRFDRRHPTGLACEQTFLGKTGTPSPHVQGYTRIRSVLDTTGRTTQIDYLDEGRQPVHHRGQGVARIIQEFDDVGNLRLTRYFDRQYQPVCIQKGYHKVLYSYHQRPDASEPIWCGASYFDVQGLPLPTEVFIKRITDPEGQAARLGLRADDVLVRYHGHPVEDRGLFAAARRCEQPEGTPRPLVVRREGKELPAVLVNPGRIGIEVEGRVCSGP